MNPAKRNHNPLSLHEAINRLLEDLARGCPPGSIDIRARNPNDAEIKLSVQVQASRATGAPMLIETDGLNVWINFGEDSRLELDPGRFDNEEQVTKLKEVCECVVAGRVEETIWSQAGRPVRSEGRLGLQSGALTTKHTRLRRPLFPRAKKVLRKYEPYC